jgi:hypothetical protein
MLKESLQQNVIAAGLRPVYHPGRAAVDPHALAANAVPVATSEVVQGGVQETPEEKAAREQEDKLRASQRDEQISKFQAATEEMRAGYEEQRSQALTAQEKALSDERDQLARRKAIEDEYATVSAKAQREFDAATSASVDPNRIFRGDKGAAAAIGSALAVGLGAFGGALSHSPNYAQQIVSAAIDRDVAAQQDQIARRGAAAQNTLAAIHRKYGLSLDESASFLKEAQLRYAAATGQRIAARIGGADALQKAAAFTLDVLGKADKLAAARAEEFKGRKTTQYAMVQPQAATAGYYSEPTAKELRETAASAGALEKDFRLPGGANAGKLSARLGATQAINRSAQEDLLTLEKADPGGWIQPDNIAWTSDARIQLDASAKAVAAKVLAGNGEPVTEENLHQITQQLTAKNPDVRKKAREYVKKGLETADKYIEQQRGNVVGGDSSGGDQ